jgi:hypothetical protein
MKEIYVEIYSSQFDAEDPVCMDDVKDVEEILGMIEAIPVEPYMMVDLYIDVYEEEFYQESYSVKGCRSLEKLKLFVMRVWNMIGVI